MITNIEKISLRQATFIFFTIISSSFIRFVPNYTARYAKQAAWLTPVASFFLLMLLFLILHSICKKYPQNSLPDAIENIIGKIPGKVVGGLYLLWLIVPISLYSRYYVERLVNTIFPNVDKRIFIIVMLLLIAYMLRSGIVVIARMNEIIFAVILVSFISITILIFPELELKRITPISSLDILPVLKASIGISELWIYILYVFFIGDKINNKEKTKKFGFKASIFVTIMTMSLIVIVIGSIGYSVVERLPLPYFAAVKQISLFNTLEKIESIVVILWVAGDFILISSLTYILLDGVKWLFRFKDTKPFINIFLIFIYFSAMYICNSRFELEALSATFVTYISFFLAYFVPLVIFAIGKIRKKI